MNSGVWVLREAIKGAMFFQALGECLTWGKKTSHFQALRPCRRSRCKLCPYSQNLLEGFLQDSHRILEVFLVDSQKTWTRNRSYARSAEHEKKKRPNTCVIVASFCWKIDFLVPAGGDAQKKQKEKRKN